MFSNEDHHLSSAAKAWWIHIALKLWPCCHLLVSTSHCRHDWNYHRFFHFFLFFLFAPYWDLWTWACLLCVSERVNNTILSNFLPQGQYGNYQQWEMVTAPSPALLISVWALTVFLVSLLDAGFSSSWIQTHNPRKQDTFPTFLRLLLVSLAHWHDNVPLCLQAAMP